MLASLLRASTAFDTRLYFHAIASIKRVKDNERSSNSSGDPAAIPVSYQSGMRIAQVVHFVTKGWKEVLRLGNLGDKKSCVTPSVYFDKDEAQLEVLQKRSDGFSPTCQGAGFWNDTGPSTSDSDMEPVLWYRDPGLDALFRVLTGFMVCAPYDILSNGHLFRLSDKLLLDWDQILHLKPTGDLLLGSFAVFPEQASQCLQLQIVRQTEIRVPKLDNDGAVASEEF